jgi:hypothetical protein
MTSPAAIVRWTCNGHSQTLVPRTLTALGKDEKFLEDVIAGEPGLLGLESRRSGVRGPFHVARQCAFPTPTGKTNYPDIVLLAASGHIIVVEVKLRSNTELMNRSVLAQIIDYAASCAALADHQLRDALFPSQSTMSWSAAIATAFPDEADPDDLADQLWERAQAGEINLVIACDSAPSGLREVIASIASQSTLGFDFDLVEVTPYVTSCDQASDIIFVPARRLATEIVARTSVTVSYREGEKQPSTEVKTMTMEEIEQNIRSVTGSQAPSARVWSASEVEEVFHKLNDPVKLALFEFAKEHSYEGVWMTSTPKQFASCGFAIPVRWKNSVRTRMAYYCVSSWSFVTLSLGRIERFAPQDTYQAFFNRLKEMLGDTIDTPGKEPCIPLEVVAPHLAEFQQLMLWLKGEMESAVRRQ